MIKSCLISEKGSRSSSVEALSFENGDTRSGLFTSVSLGCESLDGWIDLQ